MRFVVLAAKERGAVVVEVFEYCRHIDCSHLYIRVERWHGLPGRGAFQLLDHSENKCVAARPLEREHILQRRGEFSPKLLTQEAPSAVQSCPYRFRADTKQVRGLLH